MKHILAILALVAATAINVQAQRSYSSYPYWAVSKEIHKFQQRNVLYSPASMKAGNARVSSKGIAALNQDKAKTQPSIIRTGGTPSHVISKGVARKQYERSTR